MKQLMLIILLWLSCALLLLPQGYTIRTYTIGINKIFSYVNNVVIFHGLIIYGLGANSIKYSFLKKTITNPEIFISLKRNNGKIYFIVGDNKIGLPEEIDCSSSSCSLG
jgi:two-component sensor histidine kinase